MGTGSLHCFLQPACESLIILEEKDNNLRKVEVTEVFVVERKEMTYQ